MYDGVLSFCIVEGRKKEVKVFYKFTAIIKLTCIY